LFPSNLTWRLPRHRIRSRSPAQKAGRTCIPEVESLGVFESILSLIVPAFMFWLCRCFSSARSRSVWARRVLVVAVCSEKRFLRPDARRVWMTCRFDHSLAVRNDRTTLRGKNRPIGSQANTGASFFLSYLTFCCATCRAG